MKSNNEHRSHPVQGDQQPEQTGPVAQPYAAGAFHNTDRLFDGNSLSVSNISTDASSLIDSAFEGRFQVDNVDFPLASQGMAAQITLVSRF
jgi:hypothetical protein